MRKLITVLAAIALLAAVPASHAAKTKGIPYKGKTTGGHKVTFGLGKKKMYDFTTGVPMTCIPIQGTGNPITGVELWSFGWVSLGLKDYKFKEKSKPSLWYNEVTRSHTVTTTRKRNGTVTGKIRVQYSFFQPKFPMPNFAIYSCLGNTKFTAKPAR
jgi:hypothetical protein